MPTRSGTLSSVIEKLLFHPMTITSAERIGDRFARLRIQGEALLQANWIPGQAIEIYLGGFTKRAYTPMDIDPGRGSVSLLIYLHGGGPGSAWAASAKAGGVCHVMRPKDSLNFIDFRESALFFGDETSLAALQALRHGRANARADCYVLELHSPSQTEPVLGELGASNVVMVQKTEDGSHLAEVVAALTSCASTMHSPQWIFTGQARSIQTIRNGLKTANISIARSKVKAYWSPGKTGMD